MHVHFLHWIIKFPVYPSNYRSIPGFPGYFRIHGHFQVFPVARHSVSVCIYSMTNNSRLMLVNICNFSCYYASDNKLKYVSFHEFYSLFFTLSWVLLFASRLTCVRGRWLWKRFTNVRIVVRVLKQFKASTKSIFIHKKACQSDNHSANISFRDLVMSWICNTSI